MKYVVASVILTFVMSITLTLACGDDSESSTPIPQTTNTTASTTGEDTNDETTSAVSSTTSSSEYLTIVDPVEMATIPAGAFNMGKNGGANGGEEPEHSVTLNAFNMDITPVTVQAFESYIEIVKPGTNGYFTNDINAECNIGSDLKDHPANCVSWYTAEDYCKRQGKRLPTEAEYEYACGNGSDHWNFSLDQVDITASKYCYNLTSTCAVKSYGANNFGLYDMNGNVCQWCSDWLDFNYYQVSPSNNPKGPDSGDRKILRGGAFSDTDETSSNTYDGYHVLHSYSRFQYFPTSRLTINGFRCVVSEE